MRAFRSVLLRRLVAAVLLAGLGAPLAPTASAQSVETVLDDERAFDLALRAAWAADADPIRAFAHAYAEATDGAVTAEVVERVLGAASMSGVPPAVADETFAHTKRAVALGGAVVPEHARPAPATEAVQACGAAPAEVDGASIPNESRPRAP